MTDGALTADELARLIDGLGVAASAWMRGDMDAYLLHVRHSRDYTLLAPLGGGPVRHGSRGADLAASRSAFRDGEARLEEVQVVHASGDMVVLALIERQHGEVGPFPDQDWSLRVTLVLRREEGEWRLLHRHADPLVHPIGFDALAALARGP